MKKLLAGMALIAPLTVQSNDMPSRPQDTEITIQQEIPTPSKTDRKLNSMKLPNFVGKLPDYFDINLGWIIRSPNDTFFGGATILIVGEKGTGKTLLVNEIIKKSGLETIYVPMKELYNQPLPDGYKNHSRYADAVIKNALSRAKDISQTKNKSVIVFIDDLDYGYPKDKPFESISIGGNTLPDIEDNYKHIKFIATATDIDVFPKDIPYRRLTYVIPLSLPDYSSRKAIIEFHLKKHLADKNIKFSTLAFASQGFSGGDLVRVINNAAKLAQKRSDSQITQADLWTAFKPIRRELALQQWEGAKQSTQNFLTEYGPAIVAILATVAMILLIKNKNKK